MPPLAFTESDLLLIVIGVYATLVALWLLYWLIERLWFGTKEDRQYEELRRGLPISIEFQEGERDEPFVAVAAVSATKPYSPQHETADHEELQRLRWQLRTMEDHAASTQSRLSVLQAELESLKARLSEDAATASEVTADNPPALGVYDPAIEKYDADWAITDPDLGVILARRPDDADDLTRIRGVGQVNHECLNEHGVYYFQQIADWTDHNTEKFNALFSFKGRIQREQWIEQAKELAQQKERRVA